MTPKERAAMQQALEALEVYEIKLNSRLCNEAIIALREALASRCQTTTTEQANQEPMAKVIRNEAGQITMQKPDGSYFDISKHIGVTLYASPVRTKDLTDEELNELWHNTKGGWLGLFRAVIAADREKNRG